MLDENSSSACYGLELVEDASRCAESRFGVSTALDTVLDKVVDAVSQLPRFLNGLSFLLIRSESSAASTAQAIGNAALLLHSRNFLPNQRERTVCFPYL
jgi:hypothetical protein